MPILAQASDSSSPVPAGGPLSVGSGIDTLAELERLRSNVAALAEVVEALRGKHNTHTHGATVAAPPPAEQAVTAFTLL